MEPPAEAGSLDLLDPISCSKEEALSFLALAPVSGKNASDEEYISSFDGGIKCRSQEKESLRGSKGLKGEPFVIPPFIQPRRQCSMFPLSCWKHGRNSSP
ncbi:unnamed protein product [Durusdinium trenchii]|uniref:Uncharacterized protein n=1 Tax=Durusdinium trenchii TaxID=1381693 RepID=A0ABP0RQ72_9DINO